MSKKLEKQIEELKKRIEELEGKDKTPTELPFWMPTKDEEFYCYLTSCGGVEFTDFESSYGPDQERIAIGNYAETEEILEKRKAKLKLLEEIKQWRGKHDPESFRLDFTDNTIKWQLVFEHNQGSVWIMDSTMKEIAIGDRYHWYYPGGVYFSDDKLGEACIKHFGNRLDVLLEVD